MPKNVVRGADQVVAVVPMVTEFAVHVRHVKITTINCNTHTLHRNLNDKRPGASSDNNFISKKINENIKVKNRSYGRFWIYQLISTANPAPIPSNKAGLTVLISW